MKRCDLCSREAEPDRLLCDACANMMQRLWQIRYLAEQSATAGGKVGAEQQAMAKAVGL